MDKVYCKEMFFKAVCIMYVYIDTYTSVYVCDVCIGLGRPKLSRTIINVYISIIIEFTNKFNNTIQTILPLIEHMANFSYFAQKGSNC